MAMILHAFVGRYVNKLSEFVEGEMSMMLGVKDELRKLRRTMERIRGFLESAEQKRHMNQSIDMWVIELKDIMYDADDIIDRCMIEGRILLENHHFTSAVRHPSSSFSSFGFFEFQHEMGNKIKELNNRLKEINEDRPNLPLLEYIKQSARESGVNTGQTFPSMIKSDIVGTKIEKETQSLVESLIKEDDKKYRVLGIVGLGGIGKTTLASNIYNDKKIKEKFPRRVWVCISQGFSEIKLLKEIIRGVGGNYGGAETKAELVPLLSFLLSERFFIVLDDVWKPDVWENLLKYPFESATANGRIVITTRDTNVARSIRAEIHHVDKMDNNSCWKLLHKNVFGDDEEEISGLKKIGMKIVEKCDGLPLAVKVIAGVLRLRDRNTIEWSKVLESDAWSMSQLHEELPRALFLSYENLPSDLKQCFLYCSLFPGNFRMHHKDLIGYWVAEGFVKTTQRDTFMEDLAEDYYKELIWRNLLHGHDDDARCTMHDLLRSLALFLIRDESIFLGKGQSLNTNPLSKLRRLSMMNEGEVVEVPDVIKQQKCLRTLLIWRSYETKMVENELFESLRFLRVMNLSHTRLERLPDFVGDLVHLRYLNVDGTTIKELPESIGRLLNLEILHLSCCNDLFMLPEAITRLCNLRCLCLKNTPLSYIPKGIGKLKHLNHLEGFMVGHDVRSGTQDGCDLEELQSLSQLRFLSIWKLERAKPGGALVLASSHSLRTLILSAEDEEDAIAIQRINEIYGELSPQSTHLQKLEIRQFFGTGFPRWMMSTSLDVSFPSLTKITFYHCKSCPQLPPLGLLPQLKLLHIEDARAIKTIGPEFFGPCASSAATSFPKLEVLYLGWMINLEEWSFGMAEGVGEERREAPKLLPRLMKLELRKCPKLRALPPLGMLPELKYLSIREAWAIKTIGPEFFGPRASSAATSFPALEELSFYRMSDWEEWSFGMVEGVCEERNGAPKLLPRLRILRLYYCPKLRALPPLGMLPELKSLHILSCAIKTIGPEFLGSRASSAVTSFPKLEELYFSSMSNWEEWSFGMVEGVGEERNGAPKLLPHLTKLHLNKCPKLRALPPLGMLPDLKYLSIHQADAIKTIGPEFLGLRASSAATSFPKLEELEYEWMQNWEEWSFGMVEGVGEERRGTPNLLPRLKILRLSYCPKLRGLPPLGMLPELKSLHILSCAIKTIGPKFLGPHASLAVTSFPKLEELYLSSMSNWEEWSFGMVEGVGEERRGAPKLLPRLSNLTLDTCPKLRALPPLGMLSELKSLHISSCAIKTTGPEFLGPCASSAVTSFPKLEQLYLSRMSKWEEWSFGMVEGVGEERRGAPKLLPRLTKLELINCPKLRALPPLDMLPELKYLSIQQADAVKTIGREFLGPRASSAATSFPKLEELEFRWMDNWEEWSFGMVEGVGEERRGAPKLLPSLRILRLSYCPKLRALPPLGMLPELKSLHIKDARAIKTIGHEFLGPRALSAATSFPKLEELSFIFMLAWEEWRFDMVEGVGEERREAPKLLPQLRKLELVFCPKLRALPQGLQHATNLQQLIVTEAGDLIEINNLPSLKSLEIDGCPRLEHVENLDKLQFLKFETSTETSTTDADGQTESLPRWLLDLLQNAPAALPSLKEFRLTCSLPFLKTFFKDGPNWPIIQRIRIPQLRIQEHCSPGHSSSYIQYSEDPLTFVTHIAESEDEVVSGRIYSN